MMNTKHNPMTSEDAAGEVFMRHYFTCEQCYRTEDQDNAVQIADELYCLDCVDFQRDADGGKIWFIKSKNELSVIQQDAMAAVDNEASTKGMDAAPQGAWDNSCIYADTYGHDVVDFRRVLLNLYKGHICK